ncbi:hypothetical protein [Streptomyces tibetensis]|uniref:hypothetical protein n=1 Tax=Streptomyces tibetensis TaxID=2382123 RepID=UPI003404FF22
MAKGFGEMRLVAVQFRLKNIGTQVIDEAPDNDAKIRDAQGQQFNTTSETSLPWGDVFSFSRGRPRNTAAECRRSKDLDEGRWDSAPRLPQSVSPG